MKRATGFVALFLFLAISSISLHAQTDVTVDPSKMTQINRIAKAANLQELIVAKFKEGMMEGMQEMEEQGAGEVGFAQMFIEKFEERFDPNEFLEQVIAPVMDVHFTLEELTLIADFVDSDLGKKLIGSKMGGKDADVQAMLASGEISEEDGMKMMQLFIRLGKKKDIVTDGTLSKEIESRSIEFGQALAMDIVTEMMQEQMEEGVEIDEVEEVEEVEE